jgi:hypothetical protein
VVILFLYFKGASNSPQFLLDSFERHWYSHLTCCLWHFSFRGTKWHCWLAVSLYVRISSVLTKSSRWLFLLEGLVTLLLGIASFFLMPASAVQTKTWFRPDGWFTDRELTIVVNRVLRDDPSKGMLAGER